MNRSLKLTLYSGILSSIIYIATDIMSGLLTPGYSFFSQTVSELSAIGAPMRPMWIIMTFIYNPLLIAFGGAIFKLAKKKRTAQITGTIIILWGILGFVWLLFPMHLRGVIGSTGDTMHLVMTGITVILMTTLISIGSFIRSKWFQYYSFMTILCMMIFGILTGTQTANVAAQLPTPWMGITERLCSYAPLIWVCVLSLTTEEQLCEQ